MRAFACTACRRLAPFESRLCLHCGAEHGFDWAERDLIALRPTGPAGELEVVGTGIARSRCANHDVAACNGLASDQGLLCPACALTRTRPADDDETGLTALRIAEEAKRRLVFELLELGLPVLGPPHGDGALRFDLLSDRDGPVTTGHADGLVTIDLAETDDAHREQLRREMAEPYRTLLGHLRHEVAHFYETVVVGDERAAFRDLFGDERADYAEALERNYRDGPPAGWEERYVSAYASCHPWEDWAETFAHYLHMRSALQTAAHWGVQVEGPDVPLADSAPVATDPSAPAPDIAALIDAWLPLTYALNELNRSMGARALYPFVLAPAVIEKLDFVDRLVRAAAVGRSPR